MSKSETKRRYDDACGTAHGLELIGERWALLVLRELMLGARRFSDLRADLPGISANVLTQRLAELEERGLVRRRRLPPPAASQVYEATEWGLEAEPIVQVLGRWAARSPMHDPTMPISATSIMNLPGQRGSVQVTLVKPSGGGGRPERAWVWLDPKTAEPIERAGASEGMCGLRGAESLN